ncbi:hypothetical protein [Halobacteriovorax sp. ZH2_bin.1]|uniref:hypothetical protein n=1 Tax=unclassified Halobacteriovorax TaxID=2639665 RepID=UPI003722C13C
METSIIQIGITELTLIKEEIRKCLSEIISTVNDKSLNDEQQVIFCDPYAKSLSSAIDLYEAKQSHFENIIPLYYMTHKYDIQSYVVRFNELLKCNTNLVKALHRKDSIRSQILEREVSFSKISQES